LEGEDVGASNWIHLDVAAVLRLTDKAMHVELEDGELVWLPLSQVDEADKFEAGDKNLTVSITEWLAKEKGLGE
jgi:hypothetical protein